MSRLQLVALILAGIGPMLALGRLLPVPDSLLLFGAGLASSLLPGLPPLRLDPQLALQLFLPPLLYAGTVRTSLHLLRHTLASGVLLGVAASLATAVVVAAAARALLPGLPWAAALMLGAVAAVFDTRLFHEAQGRPHVPRAVADALKAREMAARVVALSCFGLAAEAAAAGGPPAPLAALGGLAWELAGGALAGAALGRGVVWLRERIDPAPVEIAVSIATPYLGALLAAALGLSTVVVIMGAALAVSAVRVDPGTGAPRTSSEARISAAAFWEEASLILSAALFFLAGRALPETAAALDDRPLPWLAGAAATLLAAVLAVEFAAGLLSARLRPPARHAGGAAPARVAGVMAWASTRSVIGLILALSIPATLPGDGGGPPVPRDLVLVMATLLIVGSVLLQGLTLNAVVRRAGLRDEGEREREGRAAREAEDAAGPGGPDARRRALLALRERDRIGDELLRERLREIDLVQRAGEGGALPGAGPPNP